MIVYLTAFCLVLICLFLSAGNAAHQPHRRERHCLLQHVPGRRHQRAGDPGQPGQVVHGLHPGHHCQRHDDHRGGRPRGQEGRRAGGCSDIKSYLKFWKNW